MDETSAIDNVPAPGIERVIPRTIEDELTDSFIDYSMSVIVSRALPDARDGLKPVHRRILFSMHETGLAPHKAFKKSATVVGDVLGKYHPHGDSSVYEALVRLAQPFAMCEPLVQGQGNFGSIDGDPAAAYRYTEAKLSEAATELLFDIDKETVDFVPNFDDRLKEPKVLPGKLPNLLLNGSSGIAVGMATNIPPHNLRELAEAIELLCERPGVEDEEVYALIQGPDFPTGALVIRGDGIREFQRTGVGRMIMRARVHVESHKNRQSLVFTEIPYGVVKSNIVEKIADLHRDKKVEGIADLRDESDREGIRIVVDLKRDADSKKVLDGLFRYTQLQTTFGGRLLALVNGAPQTLSVRKALEVFIAHRLDVVIRRTTYDLANARERLHIVDGLMIAINALDRVVEIIKGSRNPESARNKLMKEFSLSERQAQAILDLRLARLTALKVNELKAERKELLLTVERLERLLADPAAQRRVVRDETREVAEKYGRERRTMLVSEEEAADVAQRASEEQVRVYRSDAGQIWSEPVGKRARERAMLASDPAVSLFTAQPSQRFAVFTTTGRYFPLDVESIPSHGSRLRTVASLVPGMDKEEKVLWMGLTHELEAKDLSIVFVTRGGQVKRTSALEYSSPRAGGVIACGVGEDDELVSVFPARSGSEVYLATEGGQLIRFPLEGGQGIPEQGRAARGVRGIRLVAGDRVISGGVMGEEIALVTSYGMAKRVSAAEFPLQGRGGAGVKLVRSVERSGAMVWVSSVPEVQALWLRTAVGEDLTPLMVESLAVSGRATQGELLEGLSATVSGALGVPEVLGARVARRLESGASSEDVEEVEEGMSGTADPDLVGEEADPSGTGDGAPQYTLI